jgi:hypothetical protein
MQRDKFNFRSTSPKERDADHTDRWGSTVFAAIQLILIGTARYAANVKQLQGKEHHISLVTLNPYHQGLTYISPRILRPTRSFCPAVGIVRATPTMASEKGPAMCKKLSFIDEGCKRTQTPKVRNYCGQRLLTGFLDDHSTKS